MTGAFPLSVNSIVPAAAALAVSGLGTVASAAAAVANSVTDVRNCEHGLKDLERAFRNHMASSQATIEDLYSALSENADRTNLALETARNAVAQIDAQQVRIADLEDEYAALRGAHADQHAQLVAVYAVGGVLLAATALGVAYHKWDAIKNMAASGRDTFVNVMSCHMPSCLRRGEPESNNPV